MGVLDGKVVLITGAGGGIGRCHALSCAQEGAKVVVNDLGGTRDGSGAGNAMADQVVAELRELGAEAVANYDSVTDYEGCERMVATAIEAFGRLDVVVNNAGILRDRTFVKMEDAEWSLVLDVHLNGTRNVCKAAIDALTESRGAIINTTSYSGMIGNFGQSNYAAAKAGIYGFSRVLSMELRKRGISVNCIAPVAKTRMTEDIAMVDEEWGPEQISPLVIFLASEQGADVTGQVFGVQGQRIHLYEVQTNDGVEKPGTELWTAQEIAEQLEAISRFEQPAAADSGAEGDVVTEAFAVFPVGYKPDAVPGWNAVIQWKISGGTDQTVAVADGVCTVSAGLTGSPTCTVKTTKDVVVALLHREIDPQKVFMTGKATADNMGDLMKMAMAFDFEKMGEALEAASEPEIDLVSEVFSHFPAGYREGAAADWNAVIYWKVDGGTDQSVIVANNACRVAQGKEGSPTCTVKIGKDTLLDLFQGRIDAQKVFMTGKATADNMGDLMKMGMAFDFEAIAKAFEAANPNASAAPAAEATEEVEKVDKPLPIGKRYDGGHWLIEASQFQAYAEATDDINDRYTGGQAIAPPMFHVRPFVDTMMKMATDPELELDVLRLVHGEHDMSFHKAMRHGDVLQLRGTLKSVEEKSSGQLVTYGMLGFLDGEVALEGTTSYFIRGKKKKKDAGAKATKSSEGAAEVPAPTWTIEQVVTEDQATRYAGASGDENPIHIDPNTAKAAGLPGVILHGLCTMAFAQRDIVNRVCGGDPSRLKRLAVRWARPVFPGETLTLKVWDQGEGRLSFVTENTSGQTVVTNGQAEVQL